MVPWQRVLRSKSAARIKVEVDRGTARMGLLGMVPKASADLLITNDGPPIALIAHARLTNVAPGFAWASQDAWKYDPRQLKGGPDTSWFHIATVQPDDKAPNQWVVVVRAEHMVHIRRWEVQAKGALWFDLHFDFYADTGNTLRLIRSVGVHVSVADDRKSFVTNLKQ
jgi:hypothetical protein